MRCEYCLRSKEHEVGCPYYEPKARYIECEKCGDYIMEGASAFVVYDPYQIDLCEECATDWLYEQTVKVNDYNFDLKEEDDD